MGRISALSSCNQKQRGPEAICKHSLHNYATGQQHYKLYHVHSLEKCFNDGGFHGNITHTDMCKTIQTHNYIIADCVNAICVYYSVRRMLELLKLQNPTAIFTYPTP